MLCTLLHVDSRTVGYGGIRKLQNGANGLRGISICNNEPLPTMSELPLKGELKNRSRRVTMLTLIS
jgi:hypothetical protein